MDLFTVGHSNHPIEKFIQLVQAHAIKLLVDVRSTPYSRFNPQFNQANLQRSLAGQAIEYACLGVSLGGRPKDPTVYLHQALPKKSAEYFHEVNYSAVMQRPWFIQGIQQLLGLASAQPTAILCSEEHPAHCHRHLLIARYLMRAYPDLNILHIRKDGNVMDARSLTTLLDDPGTDQLSLLNS